MTARACNGKSKDAVVAGRGAFIPTHRKVRDGWGTRRLVAGVEAKDRLWLAKAFVRSHCGFGRLGGIAEQEPGGIAGEETIDQCSKCILPMNRYMAGVIF